MDLVICSQSSIFQISHQSVGSDQILDQCLHALASVKPEPNVWRDETISNVGTLVQLLGHWSGDLVNTGRFHPEYQKRPAFTNATNTPISTPQVSGKIKNDCLTHYWGWDAKFFLSAWSQMWNKTTFLGMIWIVMKIRQSRGEFLTSYGNEIRNLSRHCLWHWRSSPDAVEVA